MTLLTESLLKKKEKCENELQKITNIIKNINKFSIVYHVKIYSCLKYDGLGRDVESSGSDLKTVLMDAVENFKKGNYCDPLRDEILCYVYIDDVYLCLLQGKYEEVIDILRKMEE